MITIVLLATVSITSRVAILVQVLANLISFEFVGVTRTPSTTYSYLLVVVIDRNGKPAATS